MDMLMVGAFKNENGLLLIKQANTLTLTFIQKQIKTHVSSAKACKR